MLHWIILTDLNAHHAALVKAYVESGVRVIPVHATCLKGERFGPELLEGPTIGLAFRVLTELHPIAGDCAYCRVNLVVVACILLLLLLPWHREVSDIAIKSRSNVHFTHGHEEEPT